MSRTIFAVAAVFVSLQLVPTPAVAQYYASDPLVRRDFARSRGCSLGMHVPVHRGVPVNHPCGQPRLLQSESVLSPPLSAPVVPVRISCVRSCNEVR
jgi:hypothetical protein